MTKRRGYEYLMTPIESEFYKNGMRELLRRKDIWTNIRKTGTN
jgi:hypothetical protein